MTLDPTIHQATRLRIMAALFRNRESSFTRLRDGLSLTDGNLGSHAAALEKAGYVESRRALAGLSFEVRYRITPAGSAAFVAYTEALRALLDGALAENEEEAGDRGEKRQDQRHERGGPRKADGPAGL